MTVGGTTVRGVIHWREATVERLRAQWPGAAEYDVSLHDAEPREATPRDTTQHDATPRDATLHDATAQTIPALAYTDLVGRPRPGDRVLLNVGALDRGLGTGGLALIVAVPDRLPPRGPASPGHIVKARYTPLQTMVLGVDEQESPHHEVLRDATGLNGMPVIMADLHSAVPAILAGLREARPQVRAVYVMTDGGALPIAFSRTVAGLSEAGWLTGTITVGQAFGGGLEAVNVHTGLLAAAHVLHAEVAIVAQGPGNLGTDSPWGFSGVASGEAVNAAAVLGGRAVASLRVSEADERDRHRGVSHHSLTAYGQVAMAPADLPVPLLGGEFGDRVLSQARDLAGDSAGRLRLREVGISGLGSALASCPVRLSTMGRGLDQDRASFVTSAAAGRFASTLLDP
ncbi:MAG: DUF3866 family protein [Dermatophilaceae bacterium]|nr:DUF3866 family protein [Dermatophilaceae bacterium]